MRQHVLCCDFRGYQCKIHDLSIVRRGLTVNSSKPCQSYLQLSCSCLFRAKPLLKIFFMFSLWNTWSRNFHKSQSFLWNKSMIKAILNVEIVLKQEGAFLVVVITDRRCGRGRDNHLLLAGRRRRGIKESREEEGGVGKEKGGSKWLMKEFVQLNWGF